MSLRDQFSKPTGLVGWLVGQSMAWKNRERSEWVASMLDLKAHERVLEIGFGSGTDIGRASQSAAFVAGVDHSETMLRQAAGRNRAAIRDGSVALKLGVASQLPFEEAQFDCVFSINSVQFWKDLPNTLVGIRRVLKPGGRVLLAVQPRNKGATDETARQVGSGVAKSLSAAGFEKVRCEFREMRPVSTAAVFGWRPPK